MNLLNTSALQTCGLPSYYEGQGLIPLESLASGTPVATVNQEPLTEMVDDSVGGLFNRGDPDDLADCVKIRCFLVQTLLLKHN